MKTNITFVTPPSKILKLGFLSYQQPINLAYLAAAVAKAGFEAQIWDYGIDEFTENEFVNRIKVFGPKVIGFHCKTFNIMQGHYLAGIVKKYFPEIMTVVGGPHSSALPEKTLNEFPDFDALVIGEGEATIVNLCENVSKRSSLDDVKGLIFRKGGNLVRTPPRELIEDLDTLQYPARDLLSVNVRNRYHTTKGISNLNHNVTEIFTSRGCAGKCTFCAVNVAYGNRVRFRSVDNVLGEVEECLHKFNYNHIIFQDDTLTLRQGRVHELLKGFRKIGLKSWSCDSRVNTVSKELLRDMALSGCKKISFGIESGSEKILRLIKKNITVEQVKNAVSWAKSAGIHLVECPFIIGSHPDETYEDIKLTWKLIREIKPDILAVSTIVPYPGTELYTLMKDGGYLTTENWEDFQGIGTKFKWRTKYFSSEDLVKLQQKTINQYYLSLGHIVQLFRKFRSIHDLHYWIRGGWDYLNLAFRNKFRS